MDITSLTKLTGSFKKINENSDFASAVALTRTVKIVQADIKEQLRYKFILRNAWTERGIRIIPATKKKQEAWIYSKDWYLPEQDKGGDRSAKREGFFLHGDDFYRVTGLDRKKVTPRKLRGNKIISQKFHGNKVFRGKFKSGARFIAVKKTPGSYDPEKERNFEILYILVNQRVHIRGRKFFEIPAANAYDKHFQREYDKAWQQFILNGV